MVSIAVSVVSNSLITSVSWYDTYRSVSERWPSTTMLRSFSSSISISSPVVRLIYRYSTSSGSNSFRGRRDRDRMVVGFIYYLCNKAASSNHAHDEVCSIRIYVIKVCQWLATGRWFSADNRVSSTNKTYHHNIIEILLKVVLYTTTLTQALSCL